MGMNPTGGGSIHSNNNIERAASEPIKPQQQRASDLPETLLPSRVASETAEAIDNHVSTDLSEALGEVSERISDVAENVLYPPPLASKNPNLAFCNKLEAELAVCDKFLSKMDPLKAVPLLDARDSLAEGLRNYKSRVSGSSQENANTGSQLLENPKTESQLLENAKTELQLLESLSILHEVIDEHHDEHIEEFNKGLTYSSFSETRTYVADTGAVRLQGEVAAKKLEVCQRELEALMHKPGASASEKLAATKNVIDADLALNKHVLLELRSRNPEWKETRNAMKEGNFGELTNESIETNMLLVLLKSSVTKLSTLSSEMTQQISSAKAEEEVDAFLAEHLQQAPTIMTPEAEVDAFLAEHLPKTPAALAAEAEVDAFLAEHLPKTPAALAAEAEVDAFLAEHLPKTPAEQETVQTEQGSFDALTDHDDLQQSLEREATDRESEALAAHNTADHLSDEDLDAFEALSPEFQAEFAAQSNTAPNTGDVLQDFLDELEQGTLPTRPQNEAVPPQSIFKHTVEMGPVQKKPPITPQTPEQKTIANLEQITKQLIEAKNGQKKLHLSKDDYNTPWATSGITQRTSLTQKISSRLGRVGEKLQESLLGRSKASERAMDFIVGSAVNAVMGVGVVRSPEVAQAVLRLTQAIEDNPWAEAQLKRDSTNRNWLEAATKSAKLMLNNPEVSEVVVFDPVFVGKFPSLGDATANLRSMSSLLKKHPDQGLMAKFNELNAKYQAFVQSVPANLDPNSVAGKQFNANLQRLAVEIQHLERSLFATLENPRVAVDHALSMVNRLAAHSDEKLLMRDGKLISAHRSHGGEAGKSEPTVAALKHLLQLCEQNMNNPALKDKIDQILLELKSNEWFTDALNNPANAEIKAGFDKMWPKLILEDIHRKLAEVNVPDSGRTLSVDKNGNLVVVNRSKIEKAQKAVAMVISMCSELKDTPKCDKLLLDICAELTKRDTWCAATTASLDENVQRELTNLKATFEKRLQNTETPVATTVSTKNLEETLFGPPSNPEFRRHFLNGGYRSVASDFPKSALLDGVASPNSSQRLMAYLNDTFGRADVDLFAKKEILTLVKQWSSNPDYHCGDLESTKSLVETLVQKAKDSGSPTLAELARDIEHTLSEEPAGISQFPHLQEGSRSITALLSEVTSETPVLRRGTEEYARAVQEFSRSLKMTSAEVFSSINPADLTGGQSVKVPGSSTKTWPDSVLRSVEYSNALAHFVSTEILKFIVLPDTVTTKNSEIAAKKLESKRLIEERKKLTAEAKTIEGTIKTTTDEAVKLQLQAELTEIKTKIAEVEKKDSELTLELSQLKTKHDEAQKNVQLSEGDRAKAQRQAAAAFAFFTDVSASLRTPDPASPVSVDYASWMAITGALGSASITRLFMTDGNPNQLGQTLAPDVWTQIAANTELSSNNQNSAAYRSTLEGDTSNGRVAVPYLGLSLTDIIFTLDGNPTKGEINLSRINFVSKTVGMIGALRAQVATAGARLPESTRTSGKPINTTAIFHPLASYSDDDAYDRSVLLVPRR